AYHISQRCTRRDGHKKQAHDSAPPFLAKQISQEGGGNGDERGFPNAHECVAKEQRMEIVSDSRKKRCRAPDNRSGSDYQLTGIAICQHPHEGRSEHVAEKESSSQETEVR